MKFYISAVVLLLVVALVTGDSRCSVDDALRSIVSQHITNLKLDCTYVNDRSPYSTCPSGYIATGCSCGMACGSWDIQSSNKCHCQCANIDWTSAVCCRLKA